MARWILRSICVAIGVCWSLSVWAQYPPPIMPYPGGPPPVLPYYPAPQQQGMQSKVYDATCFNIRNRGGFLSKTARELVGSQEAQLLGAAVCAYYTGQWGACRRTTQMGADISNHIFKHAGSDYWGMIRARPGYEICRVAWDTSDWSVTGDTTFNASVTVDANTNTHVMSYYVSMKVGDRRGHWIDTKVLLEQIPLGASRQQHGCWPHMTLAWACKGANCSREMPGVRASLANVPNNLLCIRHGR